MIGPKCSFLWWGTQEDQNLWGKSQGALFWRYIHIVYKICDWEMRQLLLWSRWEGLRHHSPMMRTGGDRTDERSGGSSPSLFPVDNGGWCLSAALGSVLRGLRRESLVLARGDEEGMEEESLAMICFAVPCYLSYCPCFYCWGPVGVAVGV